MDEPPPEDNASPQAQRRLYERLRPRVAAFLRSRRLTPEEVHELTQETFLRVFQNMEKLRSAASLDSWVLRIAANAWKNSLRSNDTIKRKARVVSLQEEIDQGDDRFEASIDRSTESDDPLHAYLHAEQGRVVRSCVEELPPRMRNCLEMHYYLDRRQEEIAILLQISTQSVKSHIHQAKERLRDCARRKLEGGVP